MGEDAVDDGDLIDEVGVVLVDGWVGAAVWAVAMDVAKVSACHRPRSSRRILLLTVMLVRTEGRRGSVVENQDKNLAVLKPN